MVWSCADYPRSLWPGTVPERIHVTAPGYCDAELESSTKLSTYSEFLKSLLNTEKYLKAVGNYFIRKQLAKLCTSHQELMIEKGRRHGIEVTSRACEQCDMH